MYTCFHTVVESIMINVTGFFTCTFLSSLMIFNGNVYYMFFIVSKYEFYIYCVPNTVTLYRYFF